MKITKTNIWIVGFVIILGILLSWNRIFPSKPQTVMSDPASLSGIQLGDAPWPPELAHLRERLKTIGLPALSGEGVALHIHQHIDIFVDGKPVAVPAGIGINQAAGFISDIHVHDTSAVIHVESSKVQTFTLGQFFDIWGIKFTRDSIGSYVATADKALKVYSNGKLYESNPRELPLEAHQEVVVTYGTAEELPNSIPASYSFPAGE